MWLVWAVVWVACAVGAAVAALAVAVALALRLRGKLTRVKGRVRFGFFHPYANSGGGGERVLWCGVAAVHRRYPQADVIIYTGYDGDAPDEIIAKVALRFGVRIERPVRFVWLRSRTALESHWFLRPTMVMQSLGGALVGLEAMLRVVPDVAFDSIGCAFAMPVFRLLAGVRVGCYVHYPTISTDMLAAVHAQRPSYNNSGLVVRSVAMARVKAGYYRAFALAYGLVGRLASVSMANSSWTRAHVAELWGRPPALVFPPCDCAALTRLALTPAGARRADIVAVGQYRPEKDHTLMLRAFAAAVANPRCPRDARLVTIGSIRGVEDEARVAALRALAVELGIASRVDIRTDVPYGELVSALANARIGLHTMWNEHFGIAVVEYQAAGLVALAHDSAGPRMDIVRHGVTGILATTLDDYATAMVDVLTDSKRADAIAAAGRASVERFSEASFEAAFATALAPLFD